MGTIVGGMWAVVHGVFADFGFPISCWITFETSCLLIPAFYFYSRRNKSQRRQFVRKAPPIPLHEECGLDDFSSREIRASRTELNPLATKPANKDAMLPSPPKTPKGGATLYL
jgi:hypothetical protein